MIKRIAYLAPEIPSLSATFVYHEILALQKKHIQITSISIHLPKLPELNDDLRELIDKTIFLYRRSWLLLGFDNLFILFKKPFIYWQTLKLVLSDIFEVGLMQLSALKLFYHFLQGSSVARILISDRCEHLHIHFAHVPTQIGMYAASLSEIPYSFTSHANDLFEHNLLLQQKIERSKVAITISEYNRNFLQKYTDNIEKIQIVRCGIDTQKYLFQKKHHLGSKLIIKSLARLVEKKGMDVLILAARQLQEKGIDFKLEIAGDGPLRKGLQDLVTKNDLDTKIVFKGAMAHQKVFSWLQEADIFVLACRQDSQGDCDGIPVVLMESMAVGIPVISTRISGIPELIEDGVTGYLAEPNAPQSLADAMEKANRHLPAIANMTLMARQKIMNEFNSDRSVENLLKLFS